MRTSLSRLTRIVDGERRYGNILFEICQEVIRTGFTTRPKTTLKKGVKVRIKNKGSKSNNKRAKYQASKNEHPETKQNISNQDIHANHLEAFNSALRRKLSCYIIKTNT